MTDPRPFMNREHPKWKPEETIVAEYGAKAQDVGPTVLQEAQELIHGQRQSDYGEPSRNFADIAAGWSVIAGTDISAKQVALMMGWLKMCRLKQSPGHRDSWLDLAGYVGIGADRL